MNTTEVNSMRIGITNIILAINEVNEAIRKFREHAARLNMNEKELMAHVRDDDRSLHARSVQSLKNTASIHDHAAGLERLPPPAGNDFVANASNAFNDIAADLESARSGSVN